MSKEMYLMKHGFIGGIEDDEFNAFALDSFDEVLASFMAEDVELYESRITDEPKAIRAVIENETTDNPQFANIRQILCRIGTNIQCGNYIKKRDGWWLIPYLPGQNGIYEKAFMWYCNYPLKFISRVSGEIVTYPSYVENGTKYNSGVRDTTQMTVGTSQHIAYIPSNAETLKISEGDRFLMDYDVEAPTAYKVSQIDTTSNAFGTEVKLLRFTLVEDQFNRVTDNAELMIADYTKYFNYEAEGSSFF